MLHYDFSVKMCPKIGTLGRKFNHKNATFVRLRSFIFDSGSGVGQSSRPLGVAWANAKGSKSYFCWSTRMNAVVAAVAVMLVLSLCRVHVVVALILGALTGGLLGGLGLQETLATFQNGLGKGANIALSYALLGAFAVAIAKSG